MGLCAPCVQVTVEELCADMLKQTKVPGMKSIAFKQLTFGDAPFRIESESFASETVNE